MHFCRSLRGEGRDRREWGYEGEERDQVKRKGKNKLEFEDLKILYLTDIHVPKILSLREREEGRKARWIE